MTVNFAVTFEFETQAPLTHRGTVTGHSAGTCARRALGQAQRALGPVRWSSLNVVFLERTEDAVRRGLTVPVVEG